MTPALLPPGVVCVCHEDALAQLGEELDDLLDATAAPITARRTWLQTWFDCYPEFEPFVVLVEGTAGIDSAAVLGVRHGLGCRQFAAAGSGPADYATLPARSPAASARLAEGVVELLRQQRRPWQLTLPQLPPADATALRLASLLSPSSLDRGISAPRLVFGSSREFEAYASVNYRRNIRNMTNRLARDGLSPVFKLLVLPADVAAFADATETMHVQRDTAAGRPSMFVRTPARRFRRCILERLANETRVEVSTLDLEGELAAYLVGLVDHGVYRLWDMSFDVRWSRYGVGNLLWAETLRRALSDARFDEIDFMRGVQQFKLSTGTTVVETSRLAAWSSRRTRAAVHVAGGWRSADYYRWLGRWARSKLAGRLNASTSRSRLGP